MWAMPVILLVMSMLRHATGYPVKVENTGRNFVTAFPENIAYYHPTPYSNILLVTALHDNTEVIVYLATAEVWRKVLQRGQTEKVNLPNFELTRSKFSDKVVRVTGVKPIAVVSVSKRGGSVQTSVVQPSINLGKVYHVPSLGDRELEGLLQNTSQTGVGNDSFRVIVIARFREANIIVQWGPKGAANQEERFMLHPYQLLQLQTNGSLSVVRADQRVVVLWSHPCAALANCSCRMVVNQLRPVSTWGSGFLVPPVLAEDDANQTRLLLVVVNRTVRLLGGSDPELQSTQLLPFYPALEGGSSHIRTSSPASLTLVRPGLLVELVPDSRFSACYVLLQHTRRALLIAKTAHIYGVRLGQNPLPASVDWTSANGTGYSWTVVQLGSGQRQHVIWHPSSKIGVYGSTKAFWMSAISLKKKPDTLGCQVSPDEYNVVQQKMSWPKALHHCWEQDAYLVTPSTQEGQQRMTRRLSKAAGQGGQGGQDAWIGLRRRLLTGEWYWKSNGTDMGVSHWAEGEPGDPLQGMCAMVALQPQGEFRWSSQSCCLNLMPICYKEGLYFPLS